MKNAHFIQLKVVQEEQTNTCLFLISRDTNREIEEELLRELWALRGISLSHLQVFPFPLWIDNVTKEQFEVICFPNPQVFLGAFDQS